MKRWMAAIAAACFSVGCQDTNNGSTGGPAPAPIARTSPAPAAAAQQPAPSAPVDPVVARVAGRSITRSDLVKPLIEAHGLDMLMQLVQLELAKHAAEQTNQTITQADIDQELQLTLKRMFPEDVTPEEYPRVMEQFLQQQKISRAQFELAMEVNAYLRKVATPMVEERITEESLREAFNVLYGETIEVRHIQLANMQEVAEAQRRLAAGESFEKVAEELSRNPRSKSLGGQLPPFSREMAGLPQAFKDAAFLLKVGEVSEPVQADGWYHLIKLENRFEPKAMSFEEHRDAVRAELQDRLVTASIRELRNQLSQQALDSIVIDDPVLKAQYQARLNQNKADIEDRDQMRKQWDAERERLQNEPATTAPADASHPAIELPAVGPESPSSESTDTPAPVAPAAPTTAPAAATMPTR